MLKVNGLDFSYEKKTPLIKNLSIEIKKGETLALLGASGSGKSSFARLIAGFETPLAGEILIDGDCIFKKGSLNKKSKERSVSMVFQDFGLFPFLSVAENINLWSKESSLDSKLLESLDIKELLNRKLTTLSGGQKQRVGLARALMAKPKLLIMDEPLSQLDEIAKYRFLDYFKEISSSMTCLWITHNPLIALRVSQKICYLGKQEIFGPVESCSPALLSLHEDLAALGQYL